MTVRHGQADTEPPTPPEAATMDAPLVSDRVLIVLTFALAALLLVAVAVAIGFWHTPAAHPVDVAHVARA